MMLIDLHTHTWPLSRCSCLDPGQLIQKAKELQLDGVCLTEHNAIWSREDIHHLSHRYDFPVFRAMEVTTNYGHILVFGLEEYCSGDYFLQDLLPRVREAGGLLFLCHPFRPPGYLELGYGRYRLDLTLEVACRRPIFRLVDGIEVFNRKNNQEEDQLAMEVGRSLGLRIIGGSDAHRPEEIGSGVTIFPDRIKGEEELIAQLRAGNFRAARLF